MKEIWLELLEWLGLDAEKLGELPPSTQAMLETIPIVFVAVLLLGIIMWGFSQSGREDKVESGSLDPLDREIELIRKLQRK